MGPQTARKLNRAAKPQKDSDFKSRLIDKTKAPGHGLGDKLGRLVKIMDSNLKKRIK